LRVLRWSRGLLRVALAGYDDVLRECEAACVRACDKRMKISLMRSAPTGKMNVEMKRANFSRAIFASRCRAYTAVSEKVAHANCRGRHLRDTWKKK